MASSHCRIYSRVHFSETFSDTSKQSDHAPGVLGKSGFKRSIKLVGVPHAFIRLSGEGLVQLTVTSQTAAVNRLSCIGEGVTRSCDLWQGESQHFGSSNIKTIDFEVIPSSVGYMEVSIRSIETEEAPTHLQELYQTHKQTLKAAAKRFAAGEKRPVFINWDVKDTEYDWDRLEPRYYLIKMLGHGHFGQVYKAYDSATGEHVAVKELIKSDYWHEKYKRLALGELSTLSKIPHHLNICNFREFLDTREAVN